MHLICTVKSESYGEKTAVLCKCNKIFMRKEAIFMQCDNTRHKNYSIFVSFSYMKLIMCLWRNHPNFMRWQWKVQCITIAHPILFINISAAFGNSLKGAGHSRSLIFPCSKPPSFPNLTTLHIFSLIPLIPLCLQTSSIYNTVLCFPISTILHSSPTS